MTFFASFARMKGQRSTVVAATAAAAATTTAVACSFSLSWRNDRDGEKSHVSNIHHHHFQPFQNSCGKYTANDSSNLLLQQQQQQQQLLLPTDSSTILSPASPTLPIRMIRPNPNLEIAFDVRTRTPIYALERLTCQSVYQQQQQQGKKPPPRPPFYEETTIHPPEYRSKLTHYRNSGWDRGHMAPAADFGGNHQERNTTFTLCNVAPQHHILNMTLWCALEEWVRGVVKRRCNCSSDSSVDNNKNNHNNANAINEVVYVVTGPLWLPDRQVDGSTFEYRYGGLGRPPSLVAVPTHFFKVVVVVVTNSTENNDNHQQHQGTTSASTSIQQFACFVVPNQEPKSKTLEDYIVPWKDLEAVTGLLFFPQWATPEWKDRADYLTRQQQQQQQIESRQPSLSPSPKQSGRSNDDSMSSSSSPRPSSMLLLTDGSNQRPTSTRTLWKRVREAGVKQHADLEHLCAFGRCR
jgi:endonuclease G, mitochondrial